MTVIPQENEKEQLVEGLSQLSYKPTQYADSSWEIVGEFVNQTYFEASGFEVLSQDATATDPMFADYGGIPRESGKFRTHCPTGKVQASLFEKASIDEIEKIDPNKRTMTLEELDQLLKDAEVKGYQSAEKEFATKQTTERKALTDQFTAVMKDLAAQLKEKLAEIEKKAVAFSVEMAERLIGEAVEINPEYLLPIIKQALELTGGATVKKIHVSPQDFEFLKLISLDKQFPEYDGTWEFEADDTVRAGCIVETSSGEVNFDIQAAWDRVKDQVLKAI